MGVVRGWRSPISLAKQCSRNSVPPVSGVFVRGANLSNWGCARAPVAIIMLLFFFLCGSSLFQSAPKEQRRRRADNPSSKA